MRQVSEKTSIIRIEGRGWIEPLPGSVAPISTAESAAGHFATEMNGFRPIDMVSNGSKRDDYEPSYSAPKTQAGILVPAVNFFRIYGAERGT